MRRLVVFLLIVLWANAAYAQCSGTTDGTSIIWYAQSAAGAQDGTSAANAKSIATFEAGTGLDPGDRACLTGSITETKITLAASGSSGNRLTIDGTNATLSTDTMVQVNGHDFLKFTHFTWTDGASLPSSPDNDHALFRLQGSASDDVVIEYVYAHNVEVGLAWMGFSTNVTFQYNDIQTYTGAPSQLDIIATECGSDNLTIQGNLFENRTTGAGHNDIVQEFQGGSGACVTLGRGSNDWTVRYNKFVMNTTETNDKHWFITETQGGTNYGYGNLFVQLDGAENSQPSSFQGPWNFYNNTYVCKVGTAACISLNYASMTAKNLLVDSHDGGTTAHSSVLAALSYSLFYGISGVPTSGQCTPGCVLASDPAFTDYANNDFSLQGSSPAENAGTTVANTGSHTFDYGLSPSATWPNPTLVQRTGTWDMGAYASSAATGGKARTRRLRVALMFPWLLFPIVWR